MDKALLERTVGTIVSNYPQIIPHLSADVFAVLCKHYGPGPHDNGSDQDVHAGDGGANPYGNKERTVTGYNGIDKAMERYHELLMPPQYDELEKALHGETSAATQEYWKERITQSMEFMVEDGELTEEEFQIAVNQLEGNFNITQGINQNSVVLNSRGNNAIWKATGGDIGFHDAQSELAAYNLSQSLGLDSVPYTEIQVRDGIEGSAQELVKGTIGSEYEGTLDKISVDKIVVLDYISANPDRHSGNYIVSKTGQVYAIDNGHADWSRIGEEIYFDGSRNALISNSPDNRYTVDKDLIGRLSHVSEQEFYNAFDNVTEGSTIPIVVIGTNRAGRDYERVTNESFGNVDKSAAWANLQTLINNNGVIDWNASKSIKTVDYFNATLTRMVRNVYSNNMGGEFVDILGALVRGQMRDAYNRAYAEAGFSDALPDWLQADLEQMQTDQAQFDWIYRFYQDIIDARVDGKPIAPLLARVPLWANRWNEASNRANMTITAKMGGKLVWRYGDTQHCTTCEGLNGVVAYASEWELSGVKPQNAPNDRLECGGWRCQCALEPTEKRRSPNAWDRIMGAGEGVKHYGPGPHEGTGTDQDVHAGEQLSDTQDVEYNEAVSDYTERNYDKMSRDWYRNEVYSKPFILYRGQSSVGFVDGEDFSISPHGIVEESAKRGGYLVKLTIDPDNRGFIEARKRGLEIWDVVGERQDVRGWYKLNADQLTSFYGAKVKIIKVK